MHIKKYKKYLDYLLLGNYKVFPYLVFLTFFFLFTETYMYVGFLAKFFFVNSHFFMFLTLFSAVAAFIYRLVSKQTAGLTTLVVEINQLMLPVFIVIYFIMQYSEVVHFRNYVYSIFHFKPDNFFYILIFSAGLFSLDLIARGKIFTTLVLRIKKGEGYEMKTKFYFLGIITLLSISIFIIKNLTKTLSYLAYQNIYIVNHLTDSYDDKMRRAWGFYYDYMEFVKVYAKGDNITIASPPQESPWLTSGNAGLDRYFLYPSIVLSGDYYLSSANSYDYIMIARGEWAVEDNTKYDWPKNKVIAEKFWLIDVKTKKVTEYDGNYDPAKLPKDELWGLIKVKK